MQKTITDKKIKYEKVESSFFKGDENSFEAICVQHLPNILNSENKKFYIFRCDAKLTSPYGSRQPDLLAMTKDYKSFSIIEIETINHEFEDHVMKQMRCFTNAILEYHSYAIYKNIIKNNKKIFKGFSEKKFREMLKFVTPEFIVVVNEYKEMWRERLSHLGVQLISMVPYRNESQKEIYHFTRSAPPLKNVFLNVKWNTNYFKVDNSKKIIKKNEDFKVIINNQMFNFRSHQQKDEFTLFPFNNSKSVKNLNLDSYNKIIISNSGYLELYEDKG